MLNLALGKSAQTSILAALLFYVFANPDMFKMMKKVPGFKFVMKGAGEITHSGVAAHAVVFSLVMLLCVWLINSTMLKQYVNVVEGLENDTF